MKRNILQEAAIFYKNEILKYVFVMETYDGYYIVIYPKEIHFLHLTGVHHSLNPDFILIKDKFFTNALKGNISIDNFLTIESIEATKNNSATFEHKENQWIYNRVSRFEEIFNELILSKIDKVIDYRAFNNSRSEINADFFSYDITTAEGRYIGIKFSPNSPDRYYSFNTLIFDKECPTSYLNGQRTIRIKTITKMTKEDFILKKEKFNNTINNKPSLTQIQKQKSASYFKWNNPNINTINANIKPLYKVTKGERKKNSITVRKNGTIVANDIYSECKELSIEEIIKYIMTL